MSNMNTASLLIPFTKDRRAKESKGKSSKKHSYISLLQIILGINRLYLFNYHKGIIYSSYVYTLFLFLLTTYVLMISHVNYVSKTFTVFAVAMVIENTFLIWNALSQRKSLLRLFDILKREDTTLEPIVFDWCLYVLAVLGVYDIVEMILGMQIELPKFSFVSYIPVSAQDSEIVLFCFLLNQIYIRLESLKGQVEHVIAGHRSTKAKYAKFSSVSSLHEAYDLLRTCSRSINTAFNFTLASIFFICGTSTIIGVQNVFVLMNSTIIIPKEILKSHFYVIVFIICRCIKCGFLVTLPCYCCSLIKNQVKTVRSLLNSGINLKQNEYQRDELKAFLQLTKDNDFSQKLFSVINLSMDFPLKYLHTCLTYIIILIQFSKFID